MTAAWAIPLLVLAVPLAVLADDADFRKSWEVWRAKRLAALTAERGWLAVVDLAWLEPGENRVRGLPGTFTLRSGGVELAAAPADGYRLRGAPVTRQLLAPDTAEEPDVVTFPPRRALEVLERGGKLALRVWDADSPARRDFRGTEAFPPDPRWRIEARWEPYPTPRKVSVPTVLGTPEEAEAPGQARFEIGGRAFALEPTRDGDALFFVFRDATAGTETYGGGRFLYAAAPREGKVVLDFNRAYSPPCFFTPFATCPLARPENVLPVRVEAGEKAAPH